MMRSRIGIIANKKSLNLLRAKGSFRRMAKRDALVAQARAHILYLKEEGVTHIGLRKNEASPAPAKKVRVLPDAVAQPVCVAEEKQSVNDPVLDTLESRRMRLLTVYNEVKQCTRCVELVENRTKTVFGAGNACARLMFVGEAPGRDEDQQGLPFVGKAGQLLTKMIESIGLDRNAVFIANVLKCRPPENRNPLPEEILNCESYLIQQLDIIQPVIICALGTFASRTLLKSEETISRLRGQFHDYRGIRLLPTFHPAYLLRNPAEKRRAWEDMKMIRDALAQS